MNAEKHSHFIGELGFKVLEFRKDYAQVALDLEPWHLNRLGVVHGGVLMTLLDTTCSMCGLYSADRDSRKASVTVSLNTNFIGQARHGRIVAVGTSTASGKSLYFASAEIRSEEGALLATATSVHRYRDLRHKAAKSAA